MKWKWLVEVEERQTIVAQTCVRHDGGIRTVSQRSHGITAPSMPPPCTGTTLKLASSIAAQAKSKGKLMQRNYG